MIIDDDKEGLSINKTYAKLLLDSGLEPNIDWVLEQIKINIKCFKNRFMNINEIETMNLGLRAME